MGHESGGGRLEIDVPEHPRNPTGDRVKDEHESATEREGSDGRETISKDDIFGLLSAKRRRDVLAYMAINSAETTLSDLAEYIAAKENDTEVRLLSSQQRKRVYVALYQCHLPKMDKTNVVEFNRSRGTVELLPKAAELYEYMEISPANPVNSDGSDDDWFSERISTVRSKLDGWV